MKPTHPVELLACAIATQEGWFDPDAIPRIRNNPGDLRFALQLGASRPGNMPAPSFGGLWWSYSGFAPPEPIAVFSSKALGTAALYRQLWLEVAKGQTVRQIIMQWAPPTENNTSAYLQDVLNWTGLPADTPVLDLLPPLQQLNVPLT